MNDKDLKSTLEYGKQSLGNDSRNAKRNSGLFSFFKWLKPSGSASHESLNSDKANNNSSSCESLSSIQSSGTVASFSFVEPSEYTKNLSQKSIVQPPETDTYKARLKQRDKRRERDKNLTLRKKYNLFFNKDTFLKTSAPKNKESTKSLPLMTKPTMKDESREEGFHRRTNSDSSKIKRAGAYLHVKGKRKAPQPPGNFEDTSTASLKRRSKRLAPPPPAPSIEKPESPLPRIETNSAIPIKNEDIGHELLKVYEGASKKMDVENIQEYKSESTPDKHKQSQKFEFPFLRRKGDISTHKKEAPIAPSSFVNDKDNSEKLEKIEEQHFQKKERPTFSSSSIQNDDLVTESDVQKQLEEINYSISELKNINIQQNSESEIISNDYLKLDHGILKPVKFNEQNIYSECSPFPSKESSDGSKLWYKRHETSANLKREFLKIRQENKYEPIEKLPAVSFNRNSTIDLSVNQTKEKKKEEKVEKKKDDKRKSGVSLLANISELDREAAEILKKEKMKNADAFKEMPEFMKMKENNSKQDSDSLATPKRKSARDLIAKFNAITNVTKVTVNTALFGSSHRESKKDYFGKSSAKGMKKQQEALLESHKKRIEMIDKKVNAEKKINSMIPLMKSESASVVKKPETPKSERKSWKCAKCFLENEYWRIICHVCSAIKPYFDDLTVTPNLKKSENSIQEKLPSQNQYERILERSKTQIGFSALANYNSSQNKKFEKSPSSSSDDNTHKNLDRKEEKERLKKMLIEMKNSLPKKTSIQKSPTRTSIIMEKPEMETKKIDTRQMSDESESSDSDNEDVRNNSPTLECKDKKEEKKELNVEEKVASVLIGTKETIYENIKMKKTSDLKPLKVSSSVQTTSVITKPPEPSKRVNVTAMVKKKNSFEPMKAQDFEDIYSDQDGRTAARIYANLAQNDELSLFFNMPKSLAEMKNTLSKMKLQNKNKDTIEINRLLRRLEVAIGKGDMAQAADFAKELAQLKVNCSVIRQRSNSDGKEEENIGFSVDMFVEDKISHRGPFPLQVKPDQTVGELKEQVNNEFEIPIDVQRWILGKELATDDNISLEASQVTAGCPIFLYLVAPDSSNARTTANIQEKLLRNDKSSKSSSDNPEGIGNYSKRNSAISGTELGGPSRLYPEINSEISDVYSEKIVTTTVKDSPKIIDAIPKIGQSTSSIQSEEPSKFSKTEDSEKSAAITITPNTIPQEKPNESKSEKHLFNEVVTQTVTTALYAPELHMAQPEDMGEFDAKTLKPQPKEPEEWECHLCTLLNPMNCNVCGVCATGVVEDLELEDEQKRNELDFQVRQTPPKKAERRKVMPKPNAPPEVQNGQTYLQLMNLDNEDLVHNTEPFECVVCFTEVQPKEGVTLRECLHQFCKECLRHNIEFCDDAEVKCPYRDNQYSCNIAIQDREIKALVTKGVYDQHLAKSVAQAENRMDKSFHCKTPDCRGWCVFEDNVNEFKCPVCKRVNCLTCQAIHMGLNCKQYQQRMTEESECDENAKQTRQMLDDMVKNGEALKCPTCHVIMMKKWGCDWLRCSMCKTEICWVTRGPRWGPEGKGDISGGCQCGVNGVKCHPKCNYCH